MLFVLCVALRLLTVALFHVLTYLLIIIVSGGSCLALWLPWWHFTYHNPKKSKAASFWPLCFSLVCGMCAAFHDLFALPLGVIGRLCSVIMAVPGHLLNLNYIFFRADLSLTVIRFSFQTVAHLT